MTDENLTIRAMLEDEISNRIPKIRRELDQLDKAVNKSNQQQLAAVKAEQRARTEAAKADQLHRRQAREAAQAEARAAKEAARVQAARAREVAKSNAALQRSYGQLRTSITSVSTAAAQFGIQGGVRLAQGLGVGATALTAWGVSTTSNMEQASIALETFLGRDFATKMFNQLDHLDQMSAFTFQDLATSTQQLSAYGVANDQLFPLISSLSEIAAGTGKGVTGLQQLSLAVGQVATAGRLTGDEARQLAEFIPIYKVVGDAYGKTAQQAKAAMEDGFIVPSDLVINAIAQQTGDLQRFSGINEKQLGTILGQWNYFTGRLRKVASGNELQGKPGAFDVLTQGLKNELPAATEDFSDALMIIGPSISRAALGAERLVIALLPIASPLISAVFDGLAGWFNDAVPGIEGMAKNTPAMVTGIGNFFDEVGPHIPDLIELVGNLTELGLIVIPELVTPLASLTGFLVRLANANDTTRNATGLLIGGLLAFRTVSGVVSGITVITTAVNALTVAETRAATASKLGLLGKLGATAAGIYGADTAYNEFSKPQSDRSAAKAIGGSAAAGAVAGGTFGFLGGPFAEITVPVGAAVGGAIGGAVGIAGYYGDPGGSALAGHASASAMTSGSQYISSGWRPEGSHAKGNVTDTAGSNLSAYVASARRLGAYSKMHDAGSGLHAHTEWPTGDMPTGSVSSPNGGGSSTPINIGPVYVSQPMDLTRAVRRALDDRDREMAKRT